MKFFYITWTSTCVLYISKVTILLNLVYKHVSFILSLSDEQDSFIDFETRCQGGFEKVP